MKQKSAYRLLGVDPGTNVLGYAVIEIQGKKIVPLDIGVVKMSHLKEQPLKLKKIFERITAIIEVYRPREMAIEAPFYGKNVQAMLKLGRAQGVAMAAGMVNGVEITEYAPKRIKQSVTGNGNASKEQVAAMLKQTLKIDLDGHYLDATDALAAALCHYHQSNTMFGKGKRYNDWSGFLKDNPQRVG